MSDNKLKKGVVNFFNGKKEFRSLSNFWECKVSISYGGEERVYESGEHCFHGEKYYRLSTISSNENRKRILKEYSKKFLEGSGKTASEIKRLGGKKGLLLDEDELEIWEIINICVQSEICKYKYDNYEEVREDLKNSEGRILIHPAMRCSEEKIRKRYWEGKAVLDEKGEIKVLGRNMLGNIWMEFR
jgi:predicted NAD-dependent protein-ADP-ribosyltransferase YbiA (DUF1768 family)